MRCPNCQTLNPPQAKFCLECGNRLVVCPNCGTINVPIAKFCIECGTALASKNEQSSPAPQYATINYNSNRQTQPLPDVLEHPEERRIVTIMFADITGSTPLADHLDPEDMRAILTGYFNLMTEQIRRHGGTVEKYIGDAVMAVFGLPVTHEDDPDRAIRASLDMQAALTRFNEQRKARDPNAAHLQMRIGINTGEVAAPSASHFGRQDFLITGDAVNVAARLQQVANPDAILVGERTYLATREVFQFRPIAPLSLKGKPEPIKAWVVQGLQDHTLAITQHPRGIEGLEAPLVGRSLELTLMHATYARVQAEQHPHLITLLGPPGIGKSRLVREFIEREQETAKCTSCADRLTAPLILRGRCPPYGEGITYWPLIEILRTLLQVQGGEEDDVLRDRFMTFVRDVLTAARRSEDPQEIANAILRSIGSALSWGTDTDDTAYGRHDRSRQRSTHAKSPDQGSLQTALLRSWRVFLEALARQQPIILVIDDLQWADEALLELLELLVERMSNVPILFLCPTRPDFFERRRDWGGGHRNFTTIVLEALSREDANDLIKALLKTSELPETLIYTILSRAEGNPFFVEEIVRMLIDQGVLVYSENRWQVSCEDSSVLSELASPATLPGDTLIDLHYTFPLTRVPDTIQGVLAARIDLLSHGEKRVLQEAAIIGRTFWLSGLLELTPDLSMEVILDMLDSLMERDFIVESENQVRSPVEDDRTFSFKHILIRDVVYNNLSRIRRSQAHARLALWLEEKTIGRTETFAELLAYHYQQAVATWPAGLVTFVASTNSKQHKDQASESVQLTQAELRKRATIYLTMAGDQALHSYYTIRAIQAYSEALDLLIDSNADHVTLARMHEKLGNAFSQRSYVKEAWQEYRQALQFFLEDPDTPRKNLLHLYDRIAELPTRWLGWFTPHPDMEEVRAYIDAGLKLLEDEPISGDRAALLTYLALWYMHQGFEDKKRRAELNEEALRNALEASQIARAANDTSAIWVAADALGFIYIKQHRYQDAHQAQHQRQQLAHLVSNRLELHDLYYSLGWSHERISDYHSAAMWFGESWRIAQTMESPSILFTSMSGRMRVWYEWNRWSDARDVALGILKMVDQYQVDEHHELEALEYLAALAYYTGDDEQGDRYLRQHKRLLDQSNTVDEYATKLTRVHMAREDWSRTIANLQERLEMGQPFPAPGALSQLAELYVITGERVEVQQATCEQAITVARQAGARKYLGIALRSRGRMHLEQRHWDEALIDLQEALRWFKELDLPWERGHTFYSLGMFYRRRAEILPQGETRKDNLGRARYHFEKALGFFESLNAVHDAERVRLALMQGKETPV